MMIGEPLREKVIEPAEWPVALRQPAESPTKPAERPVPAREPEEVPA